MLGWCGAIWYSIFSDIPFHRSRVFEASWISNFLLRGPGRLSTNDRVTPARSIADSEEDMAASNITACKSSSATSKFCCDLIHVIMDDATAPGLVVVVLADFESEISFNPDITSSRNCRDCLALGSFPKSSAQLWRYFVDHASISNKFNAGVKDYEIPTDETSWPTNQAKRLCCISSNWKIEAEKRRREKRRKSSIYLVLSNMKAVNHLSIFKPSSTRVQHCVTIRDTKPDCTHTVILGGRCGNPANGGQLGDSNFGRTYT